LGRDLFARCWQGARITLFVGLAASLIDLVIGVFYGSISAFFGGKKDEIMMRAADILFSIPYFLIAISLLIALGSSLTTILISLTITGWINMARIARSQILYIKQQDYAIAAYALGASKKRILFRHLIPNAIAPILVTLTFTVPSAI